MLHSTHSFCGLDDVLRREAERAQQDRPRRGAPESATPMIAPSSPTYRSYPNGAAASILTLARTSGGRTVSW
jgi:hypothetical protein